MPELFERNAARTPEAVAVESGDETISYAELNARADRLARRLAASGVAAQDPVGILMERSAGLVVAMLAVAKLGAAYVPVDSRSPVSRMRSILRAVDAAALIVDRSTQGHEVTDGQRVVLASAAEAEDGPVTRPASDPHDLLYVMHTSGSTGTPKGVAVTHRNVIALAFDRIWQGGDHERILFHSPHAFDAATYEVWVPLLTGGRVVVSPDEVNVVLLRQLGGAEKITAVFLTTALFNAVAEADPASLSGLRQVWTGGEMNSPRAIERVQAACPRTGIFHVYGPTETTTFATYYRVPRDSRETNLPIGDPMDNTRAYVLDEALRQLPAGAVGQLYLAGEGVARGYAGRPGMTAERFLPDPFGVPGDRMYATGDLVRRDHDGHITFVGRADDQVKIHGFRIEPGEIESVLLQHPAVSQAVVVVDRLDDGEGRITAYLVLSEQRSVPDGGVFLEYLAERLPEYMIPARISILPSMPLNANEKIDRSRLAELGRLATPTERILAELWTEFLDGPVESSDASFWDLGGHSMLGVKLVARVRERFAVEVRLRDLFRHSRLGELASLIDTMLAERPAPDDTGEGVRELAASDFQQRIWLAGRLQPETGLYNVPHAWRVTGRLDPERLAAALYRVIERHESLRTTFAERGEALCQVIGPPWQPVVSQDGCADGARLAGLLRAEADCPFDLAAGPLLRAGLIETPGGQVLTITVHHIVFDVVSAALLLAELDRYYRDPDAADEPPRQYRDLAEAARVPDDRALARVAGRLRGAPARLPASPPGRPEQHGVVPLDLPGDVVARMRPLREERGASWFIVAAAALAGLLHRWTGSDDVTFGFPADTRAAGPFADVIGACLATVVVRSCCDRTTTAGELLDAVRDGALEALDDQHVPFGTIVGTLNPPRSAGSTPYLDVVLAPQTRPAAHAGIGGHELTPLPVAPGTGTVGKFALTLSLTVTGDGMSGALLYRGDRVSAQTAHELGRRYPRMLEAVISERDTAVADLDLGEPWEPPSDPVREAPGDPVREPASDLERRVAGIWLAVLGAGDVGTDDSFFEVGGNSLKLVVLHAKLCAEFDAEVPIQRLFDNATVRAMTGLLGSRGEPADPRDAGAEDRGAGRREHLRRLAAGR